MAQEATLLTATQEQRRPRPVHARLRSAASALSDAELLGHVVLLARAEREATVELVAHLAELDARRLYLGQGYGSLFMYCTGALHLAEHAAYTRIEVARASREFPAILGLLVDGSLNLTTARLLAPHLRPDNFEAVVEMARGKSKREVEVLVAALAPRPDVPSSVRRLPAPVRPLARASVAPASAEEQPLAFLSQPAAFPPQPAALLPQPAALPPEPDPGAALPPGALVARTSSVRAAETLANPAYLRESFVRPPADRAVVAPLAPARYRVQFTMGEETNQKLRRVQDLLRREIPDGDPGAIFDRALTLLLADIGRKKLAETSKPLSAVAPAATSTSRVVPASVRRDVWVRDAGRCAFVATNGRRCAERAFLELHHRDPFALGGRATVANIALRCARHHALETERAFGPRVVSVGPRVAPLEATPGGGRRTQHREQRNAHGRTGEPQDETRTLTIGQANPTLRRAKVTVTPATLVRGPTLTVRRAPRVRRANLRPRDSNLSLEHGLAPGRVGKFTGKLRPYFVTELCSQPGSGRDEARCCTDQGTPSRSASALAASGLANRGERDCHRRGVHGSRLHAFESSARRQVFSKAKTGPGPAVVNPAHRMGLVPSGGPGLRSTSQ
jgi:hypothetical protein